MARIAVDIVPVWIGLGFLVVIAAVIVAYQVHMRVLRQEVRRVQRERSLERLSAPAVASGGAERRPEGATVVAPVLRFSMVQRLWAERPQLEHADSAQDPDARTIARSASA